MELQQLKTFVVVAREGSITRASELLHVSQPAVSAHIKTLEDALDLTLFERTARGMRLTADGQRLLAKAQETLRAHQELLAEAARVKGQLTGKLRVGAPNNSNHERLGELLTALAEGCPGVEVVVQHGTSRELLASLRHGTLDTAYYNEGGEPDPELAVVDVSEFRVYVAAAPGLVKLSESSDFHAPGLVKPSESPDFGALADLPWIYPPSSACCGRVAEALFQTQRFRPQRVISVDREAVTCALIASGVGLGLLHATTAEKAAAAGEVELVFQAPTPVRVLFAYLQSRAHDPSIGAAATLVRSLSRGEPMNRPPSRGEP